MNTIDIFELIKKLSGVLVSFQEDGPTPSIYVRADHISTVMRHLRETKNLEFDVLMNHTAFHDTENPKLLWHLFFEIATDQAEGHEELRLFWHLYSYTQKHELTIESSIPVGKPEIDSMTSIWKSANWLERESYDLLGIRYIGHPDLRRIMLPEDWEGFPLRKDYVTPLAYQNIDNTPSEITQSFKAKDKQK